MFITVENLTESLFGRLREAGFPFSTPPLNPKTPTFPSPSWILERSLFFHFAFVTMGCQIDNLRSGGNEKKEKKRKRKLEEALADDNNTSTANLGEGPEIVASKKEKKKKNKKSKERENGEEERVIQLSEDPDEESDEKKKKNKDRKNENGGFSNGNAKSKDDGVGEEKQSYGGVVVSGKNSSDLKYAQLKTFSDSGLPKDVLECCKDFAKPSPIQSHAWPYLLDGRDFIGIAQTGSGKTLAFGVPAMMHVLGKRKSEKSKRVNPLCLVLSPTRELAQQIADVLCSAGKSCGVKSSCFYGGTSKGPQIAALKSGVDIVIGTPGRLKDLIEMGVCRLNDASFVVLDEADRMLDMGFEKDVRSILGQTCSTRQMVMFSATWPMEVHQLAQEFMDPNPVKVVVGSEDLSANHDVMQIVEVLDEWARDKRLLSLLEKYHESQRNRVIVFVLYQKEADRVERMLQGRGWKVVGIHAGKQQAARTKSLSLFKSGACPLLVFSLSIISIFLALQLITMCECSFVLLFYCHSYLSLTFQEIYKKNDLGLLPFKTRSFLQFSWK